MGNLINLNQFLKLEDGLRQGEEAYNAQEKIIEEYRRIQSERGYKPELLIGASNAIQIYLETVYGEPDWSNEIIIQIDPEDETSMVRVLRTVDIKGLTIHLV